MGRRFKNTMWVKVLGWISVLSLTLLNLINLPGANGQIAAFFGDNATKSQLFLANIIAYALIVAIIALLVWTIVEILKGNKRYQLENHSVVGVED
ncbi:hypothetical protein ATX37_09520 [Oenococcus oeni]|nr:hypothetical protein ATX37_09520 [Oenococcus oeni]